MLLAYVAFIWFRKLPALWRFAGEEFGKRIIMLNSLVEDQARHIQTAVQHESIKATIFFPAKTIVYLSSIHCFEAFDNFKFLPKYYPILIQLPRGFLFFRLVLRLRLLLLNLKAKMLDQIPRIINVNFIVLLDLIGANFSISSHWSIDLN